MSKIKNHQVVEIKISGATLFNILNTVSDAQISEVGFLSNYINFMADHRVVVIDAKRGQLSLDEKSLKKVLFKTFAGAKGLMAKND